MISAFFPLAINCLGGSKTLNCGGEGDGWGKYIHVLFVCFGASSGAAAAAAARASPAGKPELILFGVPSFPPLFIIYSWRAVFLSCDAMCTLVPPSPLLVNSQRAVF